MSIKLQGGSAGEPVKSFGHPFVHPNVEVLEFQTKNVYPFRILPGFDPTLEQEDPAFMHSYVPYRDLNGTENADGHLPFTAFYFVVQGHKFIGNGKRGFLSPLTAEPGQKYRRGVDPIADCANWAGRKGNDNYHYLTEKKPGEKNAIIEWPRKFGFLNGLAYVEDQWINRLGICTIAAVNYLQQTLNILRPAQETHICDPDNSGYLFGDVTSPLYGLLGSVKETSFNSTKGMENMKAACFHFSDKPNTAKGVNPFPLFEANEAWGWDVLAKRYVIGDIEKVTKITPGEEILDYLVQDGVIPTEVIEGACAEFWQIPTRKTTINMSPRGTPAATATPGAGAPAVGAPRPPQATGAPRPAPGAATPAAPRPASATPPRPAQAALQTRPATPAAAPTASPTPPRPAPTAPAAGAPRPPAAPNPSANRAPLQRPATPAAPAAPRPPAAATAPRPPAAPAAPRPPAGPAASRPAVPAAPRPPVATAPARPTPPRPPQAIQPPAEEDNVPMGEAPEGEAPQSEPYDESQAQQFENPAETPADGAPAAGVTPEEEAYWQELNNRFQADPNSVAGDEMTAYCEIGQRRNV